MTLILLLGDAHIPHRAIDIPLKFKKLFVPGKIQLVLATGNLGSAVVLQYLKTIAPIVHCVRGDMDEFSSASTSLLASTNTSNQLQSDTSSSSISGVSSLPNTKVIEQDGLKIGIIHGHQLVPPGDVEQLGIVARHLDVDVLVNGHTHMFSAYEWEGRFFINPGSITGASTYAAADDLTSILQTDSKTNDTKKKGDSSSPPSNQQQQQQEQEQPATQQSQQPQSNLAQTSLDLKDPAASFVLMDLHPGGTKIILYIYREVNGEVKVEKMEYIKK